MKEYDEFSPLNREQKKRLVRQSVSQWRLEHKKCGSEEEIAGFADGALKSESFSRWLHMWRHQWRCAFCRSEVRRVRKALIFASRDATTVVAEPRQRSRREVNVWRFAVAALAVAVLSSSFALYEWRENIGLRETINQQTATKRTFQAATEKAVQSLAASARNELEVTVRSLDGKTDMVMRDGSFTSTLTLGRAFVFSEQFDKAIPLIEKAKRIRPNHDDPYKLLATVYKIKAAHEESIRQLDAILERQPQDPDTWTFLGWSYFSLGKIEEARKAYEQSLRISPSKNADALFNLALLEQQQGNNAKYQELLEKARQVLRDEVSASPGSAIAHFQLAKIYAHEKNWDQATAYLKTAVAIDSEWAFWASYEVFFQEMFKAYPETEKTLAAFADVYVANYVTEACANKRIL